MPPYNKKQKQRVSFSSKIYASPTLKVISFIFAWLSFLRNMGFNFCPMLHSSQGRCNHHVRPSKTTQFTLHSSRTRVPWSLKSGLPHLSTERTHEFLTTCAAILHVLLSSLLLIDSLSIFPSSNFQERGFDWASSSMPFVFAQSFLYHMTS